MDNFMRCSAELARVDAFPASSQWLHKTEKPQALLLCVILMIGMDSVKTPSFSFHCHDDGTLSQKMLMRN